MTANCCSSLSWASPERSNTPAWTRSQMYNSTTLSDISTELYAPRPMHRLCLPLVQAYVQTIGMLQSGTREKAPALHISNRALNNLRRLKTQGCRRPAAEGTWTTPASAAWDGSNEAKPRRACHDCKCRKLKNQAVLNTTRGPEEEKKVSLKVSFVKRPRVADMFNDGWWRLAVGGWWRLAVGGWWRLAAGGWRLAVGGGWWRLVAVGGWRCMVPCSGP